MSGPTSHGRKARHQATLDCGCTVWLSTAQVRHGRRKRLRVGCGTHRRMAHVKAVTW